ncbi:flagellin [Neorhizobium sp. NCHU2750]|uniref:flagellin N-terminal helical domain-containing protein n=1 Tax=Neorhizobium sp. NCHU2750 TaxID=1825976 RepID=UPI0013C4DAED
MTNISAMSALQTLRSVSSGLDKVQNEASSGLKVAKAADNVAYWSISTTMRSDRKAISAANDALGVGAAKVDAAYAGTEAIVDILSDVKATLVTAKESSVDRQQIQNQISALSDQAENIAQSASFAGVNYLDTEGGENINAMNTWDDDVVDGFTRDSDGTVNVSTTKVDLRKTSMLNFGGGGILQKDDLDYYMPLGTVNSSNYYHEGYEDHTFSGPQTFGDNDYIDFSMLVDDSQDDAGISFPIHIDKSVVDAALGSAANGVIATAVQARAVLQQAFVNAGADQYADAYGTASAAANDTSHYEIRTLETSGKRASSIYIGTVSGTLDAPTLGLNTTPTVNYDNLIPYATQNFVAPFKVMVDATISFDVAVDNHDPKTYVIDRDAVDNALGRGDGMINDADDLKTVIDSVASTDAGMWVSSSGNSLTFRADQDQFPGYGNQAVPFYISQFRTNQDFIQRFDLSEIDVTKDDFSIDDYIDGVDNMLKQSIDTGAMLGSVQQRIDLASNFAHTMMNQIDTGVSRLTDADMEETSARLNALQTQKQLAVQSLQIANSGPQNILSLFQS